MHLRAYNSNFTDVEDAIQYFTALEHEKIDYFITRNTKDFRMAEPHLPVLSPSQFLKLFLNKIHKLILLSQIFLYHLRQAIYLIRLHIHF